MSKRRADAGWKLVNVPVSSDPPASRHVWRSQARGNDGPGRSSPKRTETQCSPGSLSREWRSSDHSWAQTFCWGRACGSESEQQTAAEASDNLKQRRERRFPNYHQLTHTPLHLLIGAWHAVVEMLWTYRSCLSERTEQTRWLHQNSGRPDSCPCPAQCEREDPSRREKFSQVSVWC